MSRVYDNWERLVEAILDRDQLRQLASRDSFSSSSSSDFSQRFSFDYLDINGNPIYHMVQPIKFDEIKEATRNFDSILLLGEEGFGRVYKGWINQDTLTAAKHGSGMAVAVKKWNHDIFQGYREWLNEINYSSQLHHPNVVQLVGYCSEGGELLLVHELMPRGSVENYLFTSGHQFLSWDTRIKVGISVSSALSYLHSDKRQVILGGFKAAHVLLDWDFNAKLSNFFLAKNGPTGDRTHIQTLVMGSYGYAAPEYVATGHLTAKCDVYAFGVFLLELLSGRRVFDRKRDRNEQHLVKWAKPFLSKKKKLDLIMDTKLEGKYPLDRAYKVAILALKCLNTVPERRPCMAEVLGSLQQIKDPKIKNNERIKKISVNIIEINIGLFLGHLSYCLKKVFSLLCAVTFFCGTE